MTKRKKWGKPQEAVAVEYLSGWDLLITFENGEKRVHRCDDIPTSERECDQRLKDPEYFKRAYICPRRGTLAWDEELDTCPDALYFESIPYEEYLKEKEAEKDRL